MYIVEFFKIINITGDIINNKLNNKKNSNLLFQKNIVAPILSELTTLLIDLIIIKITEITIRIEKGIERVPSIQTGI